VGGAAHFAEERKVKEYSKLWDIEDTTRASLHFFGVELTGCMGPEAINLCKQMSNLTGEGPEGLNRIFELFSIGFQTNRAIRLAFMMREVRNRGLGLGARMVTGLG
jgi:hypothetical protein